MRKELGQPIEQRFWSKVAVTANPKKCWNWLGGQAHGYGYFPFLNGNRTNIEAHRFAYELIRGPIPKGKVIDHLCRNRLCVNPDHMEPVSIGENILRGDTIAARYAKRTHCKRGHPLFGDNLSLTEKGRRRCIACRNFNRRQREMNRRIEMGVMA